MTHASDPTAPPALTALGWSAHFADQLGPEDEHLVPARVATLHRSRMSAETVDGPVGLTLPPKANTAHWAVGDWVMINPESHLLVRTLERRTLLQRRTEGGHGHQLIAANIDTLFVATSCNEDLNVARLERYLAVANEAGIHPVIVLTKADTVADVACYRAQVEGLQRGLDVVGVNGTSDAARDALAPWCGPGMTVALVGSSGVGKSTLLNTLAHKTEDDAQLTGAIREDDAKGRHTTTSRSLHAIPGGGQIIDTPGIRTLHISDISVGLDMLFAELAELVPDCRFRNCTHVHEPGCAVLAAVNEGRVDAARFDRWQKLHEENRANTPVETGARGNRVVKPAPSDRRRR